MHIPPPHELERDYPWLAWIFSAATGAFASDKIRELIANGTKKFIRHEMPSVDRDSADEAENARLMMRLPEGERRALENWIAALGENQRQDWIKKVLEITFSDAKDEREKYRQNVVDLMIYFGRMKNDRERTRVAASMRLMKPNEDDYADFMKGIRKTLLEEAIPAARRLRSKAKKFATRKYEWDPKVQDDRRRAQRKKLARSIQAGFRRIGTTIRSWWP